MNYRYQVDLEYKKESTNCRSVIMVVAQDVPQAVIAARQWCEKEHDLTDICVRSCEYKDVIDQIYYEPMPVNAEDAFSVDVESCDHHVFTPKKHKKK